MGAVLAALRNESIKFYAASMGSNFFLLSSTYIGESRWWSLWLLEDRIV